MKRIQLAVFCLLFSLSSSCCVENVTTAKTALSLLTFLPFDVKSGQLSWLTCNASINVAIDYANTHENILPGYRLVQHIENEGPNAILSNAGLIRYIRNEGVGTNNSLSPVIVGPTVACHVSALGIRMLHFTAFSPQCAGPYIVARRQLYSTLYSAEGATAFGAIAAFAVVKHIGKWSQFAIITNANNVNEYMYLPIIQTAASKASMQVLLSASEYDITNETIANLKASNARIVVVATTQLLFCMKLLCLAHIAGIQPPLYFFVIASLSCLFDPDGVSELPPGCTRSMLKQQLQGTIFGSLLTRRAATENRTVTSFGYDDKYFEDKVRSSLNGLKPIDYEYRHICHDAAMAAIITLNKSETVLQTVYNKTLKDFATEPELIGKVVNDTASKSDFIGIRFGRFVYDSEAELKEDLWIVQSPGAGELRPLYRMKRLPGAKDYYDLSSWQFIELDKPLWPTESGNPPQDLSEIVHLTRNCGIPTISVAIALSLLITLGQLSALVATLKKPDPFSLFDNRQKLLLFFGCLCLNLSAIILLVGYDYFPIVECSIRPVLTTVGMAFLNSVLLMQITGFAKLMGLAKKANPPIVSTNLRLNLQPSPSRLFGRVQTLPNTVRQSAASLAHLNVTFRRNMIIVLAELLLSVVSVAIMISWILSDPLVIDNKRSPIEFNNEIDSYFDVTSRFCSSAHQTYWLAGLIVFHICQLFAASFLVYISKRLVVPTEKAANECKFLCFAIENSTILFLAIILITLIMSSTNTVCGHIAVVAFGELFYSASAFCLMMIPHL